ncbi:DoxX family protein [Streptomyces sp. JH14]|uniref:DoxX family protein n=1 Tax=Streptomyces sp. JH14 TaxID=2793630 RepID=UPI0023F7FB5D|nr:DoxX family protein [Streptomyces sp. JH14]MDF6041812.1 DoxX family protein [Streptomyces sp. JH14]
MSETTTPTHTTDTAAPTAATRSRGAVALTVARVALALFFAFSAFAKLIAHESAIETFDRMGWSHGAMYLIGALEMAGAVALLVPLLSGVAAMAFVGLLAGASVVQLTLLDPVNAIMPALLIVLVVLIARDRRDRTAQLIGLVRRRA